MKLRVIKEGDYYYPQYKSWFFWRCFYEQHMYGGMVVRVRKYIREDAVAYCKSFIKEQTKTQEVVWEN